MSPKEHSVLRVITQRLPVSVHGESGGGRMTAVLECGHAAIGPTSRLARVSSVVCEVCSHDAAKRAVEQERQRAAFAAQAKPTRQRNTSGLAPVPRYAALVDNVRRLEKSVEALEAALLQAQARLEQLEDARTAPLSSNGSAEAER